MIKNQIIYFGHGSTSIENDEKNQQLIVSHITPSEEVEGEPVSPTKTISTVIFPYSHEFEQWEKQIKQVNEQHKTVLFNNYIFDFSACNQEAVRVVHARVLRGFHEWKWSQKKNRS